MKKFLLVVFCVSIFGSLTFAAGSVVSPEEEKAILQEIDSICGDTWCEGDFGYTFNDFDCYSERGGVTCELDFEMIWTDYVESTDPDMEIRASRAYPVSCTIRGLSREEIVDSIGDQITYAEPLYEKISNCIGALEEHLIEVEKKIGG